MDEVDIKCTHAIPVGDKGGPCPVVHAIGWNPNPLACPEAHSSSMIGCVSSIGVQIYNLKKKQRKWTPLEIEHRPTSEGTSLEWHKGGQVLATASSGWGGKPGTLSILAYDGKIGFRARTALQCPEGESISSLCWARDNSFLILALQPSSTMCFLRVTDDNPENLENLGVVKYSKHFDERSRIILASDRVCGGLFAYSYDKFVVFQHSGVDQVTWEISNVINLPTGIRGMVYDYRDHGLFTIEKDKWTYWKIDEGHNNPNYLTKVASSPDNEHARRRGRGRNHDSEYMSIAVSRSGKYVATGGKDTLCYHKKHGGNTFELTTIGCRGHDVNYGDVKCIEFKPTEEKTRMLALGGDTGYVHIWAVVNRGTMKGRFTEAKRDDEHKKEYYSGPFSYADRQDDQVVVELDKDCIILRLEDTQVEYEDASTTKDAGETSGSAAAVDRVAAAVVSTKTSTNSDPGNIQGKTATDRSNVTLSDQLATINQESNELRGSQTDEQMSQHPYKKMFDKLKDVADQAVDNVMSLGARADDMLTRRDQLTPDEVTAFLEMASAARRGRV